MGPAEISKYLFSKESFISSVIQLFDKFIKYEVLR